MFLDRILGQKEKVLFQHLRNQNGACGLQGVLYPSRPPDWDACTIIWEERPVWGSIRGDESCQTERCAVYVSTCI